MYLVLIFLIFELFVCTLVVKILFIFFSRTDVIVRFASAVMCPSRSAWKGGSWFQ